MEAAWLLDFSFPDLVNKSWSGTNVLDCIKNFTKAVVLWNKNVFGNIFRKEGWILSRIEGVQKSQEHGFAHNLQFLEKELISEFNNVLSQEEIHRYPKY